MKVGNLNISFYEEMVQNVALQWVVLITNGTTLLARKEIPYDYAKTPEKNASIATEEAVIFMEQYLRELGAYTIPYLKEQGVKLEPLSVRTLRIPKTNQYFCRIDDTHFFKRVINHGNLVKDKNGYTIIQH